jgi:hypothetical protein
MKVSILLVSCLFGSFSFMMERKSLSCHLHTGYNIKFISVKYFTYYIRYTTQLLKILLFAKNKEPKLLLKKKVIKDKVYLLLLTSYSSIRTIIPRVNFVACQGVGVSQECYVTIYTGFNAV